MKKRALFRIRFKRNRVILVTLFIALSGLLLGLYSCKKDQKQPESENSPGNKQLAVQSSAYKVKQNALQSSAYKALKGMATAKSFDDLDWNKINTSDENGIPSLLWIHSKTDSSKYLLYGTKDGVISTRWVQFAVNNGTGKIVVSSINGTDHIESSLKNGKIYAQKIVENGNVRILDLNKPSTPAVNTVKNFKVLSSTMSTNAECGSDSPPPPPPPGGGTPTDVIANGGTLDGFTWTGVNQLPVVAVYATAITYNFYSLYILMGNNASYGFNYTNPPNSGGGTGTGAVIGVAPAGGGYGVDKYFVKGKSPFTGQATYIPASSIVGGWKVSIAYTLVTTNGVTKPVVGDIGAEVIGAMSMVVGYHTTVKTTQVIDQTIYFTFDGSDVYAQALDWHNSVKMDGTYNTATGVYSLYIHRAP